MNISELFDKCKYILQVLGKDTYDFDYFSIDENGICARFSHYCCGENDTWEEYIDEDWINTPDEELPAKIELYKKQEEEKARAAFLKKQEEERLKKEKQEKEAQEREQQLYLKLKEKYDKKIL